MSDAPWPTPNFHFKVTFGDLGECSFQETSGLAAEFDVIEYRPGNHSESDTIKMPGLKKSTDVILKKGLFRQGTDLDDYFRASMLNAVSRQTVTINLLDEEGKVMFTWTLANAWPMKFSGRDGVSENAMVAVEEIVLAYESLTMEKG